MEIGADEIENKCVLSFIRKQQDTQNHVIRHESAQWRCGNTNRAYNGWTSFPLFVHTICDSSGRFASLPDAKLGTLHSIAIAMASIKVSLTILKFQFANCNHPIAAVLHPDIAGTFAFTLLTIQQNKQCDVE